jgi:sulfoxide reductase catalytic subunit YedY
VLIKQSDKIKSSEITNKDEYLSRRKFIKTSVHSLFASTAINTGLFFNSRNARAADKFENILKGPYSKTDEELTKFEAITTYNNFAEFGIKKEDPAKYAGQFKTKPWSIVVEGECNRPGEYGLEDIINPHQLEERIYRLRCVEAWSMVIPWIGIPLADVLKRFEPNSNAKYVAFTTAYQPDVMPGIGKVAYNFPFSEGLRIDEAMHPLTLLAVGLYGEELPNVNGAPIRLIVPWKYGFKSIKSIVNIRFVESQPPNTFNVFDPKEFGFYANVNPEVDHPRWSQGKERRIGHFLKQDTQMYNGYADQVAALYSGMNLNINF